MSKTADASVGTPPSGVPDAKTEYPHIVRRPGVVGGRPRIEGSRIPVWQIASRWNADETLRDILETYPHISPAAVHSALAYYWDHKDEIDEEIEENRPDNVLAGLRADSNLVEERPGVFRGKTPEELARERAQVVALYLDEDEDPLVARRHRASGYDIVSAHDAGMLGASDEEQLAYAARERRALVTFNIKDFAPLHARWLRDGRQHAGIIVSRQYKRAEIGELLRLLENVLQLATDDDLKNRLCYLSEFDVQWRRMAVCGPQGSPSGSHGAMANTVIVRQVRDAARSLPARW